MRLLKILALSGMFAAALAAGEIGPPVAGYVYDGAARAVRPVMGVPGAAVLGDPLALEFVPSAVWVSPRHDYLLAVDAADGAVRLAVAALNPRFAAMAQAMNRPETVIFSPRGSATALWGNGALQIWTGLPDAPSLALEISGQAKPLAVSDDGSTAVLAGARVLRSGAPITLPGIQGGLAAAFTPGSGSALVAGAAGELLLVDEQGAASPLTVDAPLADIAGAAFSPDGKRVFLAARDGQLGSLDLESGALRLAACGCRPDGLSPLSTGSLFRLTSGFAQPVFLLDGSGTEPRVWFIPAASKESSRSDQ